MIAAVKMWAPLRLVRAGLISSQADYLRRVLQGLSPQKPLVERLKDYPGDCRVKTRVRPSGGVPGVLVPAEETDLFCLYSSVLATV